MLATQNLRVYLFPRWYSKEVMSHKELYRLVMIHCEEI